VVTVGYSDLTIEELRTIVIPDQKQIGKYWPCRMGISVAESPLSQPISCYLNSSMSENVVNMADCYMYTSCGSR